MKQIKVEFMYGCPFKATEEIQLGEMTIDTNDICLLQNSSNCSYQTCPLRKARIIKVVWAVDEGDDDKTQNCCSKKTRLF